MNPILFPENQTVFTSNGIGRLSDAISCKVTEARNGQYELTLTYPMTGAHYSDIEMRSIIVAKPSAYANNQPFRVYKISKPIDGKVTINARHISYDLSKNVSMPFSEPASAQACANVLAKLKANAVEDCPFTFTTDVTTVASYKQTSPSSIRQRLGGIEGSVLDQFGGEYEFDLYNVILHKNRGELKNYPLKYGKNITDIKQEENISNTITGIVPFWSDMEGNNLVTLPEKVIYAPNASLYPHKLTVPYDLSGSFQEQPTVEQLRNAARAYINQSGIGVPKVSIDLSFINLADTEEYKDIANLQNVSLCDTIPVEFEPLGISVTAKIVETEYDVLAERYTKLTVGSLRTNLATTITDQNANITESMSSKFNQVGNEINNATAWLTSSGGYVIAVKNADGSWKELLFLDDNDIDEAVNVLRINENGIGFSSNGVDGPYTQAWTLDGRLVIGGTNVPSITVYDDNDDIIFQASADAMIWNATNSSMDATGVISMTGAQITGGKITQTYQPPLYPYRNYLTIENGTLQYGTIDNTTGAVTITGELGIAPYNSVENLLLKSYNGDINIDANNKDLYLSNIKDIWINNYGGHTGYVTGEETINHMSDFNLNVTTDTVNDVTYDLDIDMNAGTASWNSVTFEYVTWVSATWNDHQTSVCVLPEYARKGIVT